MPSSSSTLAVSAYRARITAPSSARHRPRAPGKSVTLSKELGTGGFGVVHHVWSVSTGEQYALKKPKEDSCEDG